jgi:hypothetical protein
MDALSQELELALHISGPCKMFRQLNRNATSVPLPRHKSDIFGYPLLGPRPRLDREYGRMLSLDGRNAKSSDCRPPAGSGS